MFDGNSIEFHSSHHHYHFLLRIHKKLIIALPTFPRHTFSESRSFPALNLMSHKWNRENRMKLEFVQESNDDSKMFCRGGSDSTRNTRGDCAQCQIFLPLFRLTLLSTAAAAAFFARCRHSSVCIVNGGGKSWLRFGKLIIAKCQHKRRIVTLWNPLGN